MPLALYICPETLNPKPHTVRILVHAEPHADCGQRLYSESCHVSDWCRVLNTCLRGLGFMGLTELTGLVGVWGS